MLDLRFLESRHRLAMGLHSLDEHDWLEIGSDLRSQMAERRRLLAERPADVVAALPESGAAQRELFAHVTAYLPARFPDCWQRSDDGLVDRTSGECFSSDPADPLQSLGKMAQEDFCVMEEGPTGYRLTAAVLCFPAHWRLADKLGRPLDVIHEPVPGFAERLAGPVERFFAALQVERPVWRLNWSLADTSELYCPPQCGGRPKDICLDRAGEQLWLRSERQTLRRLPVSRAVVFTIRTYLMPLKVVTAIPARAGALAARVREMPPAMAAYKGIAPIRASLLKYLDRCAHISVPRGAEISVS